MIGKLDLEMLFYVVSVGGTLLYGYKYFSEKFRRNPKIIIKNIKTYAADALPLEENGSFDNTKIPENCYVIDFEIQNLVKYPIEITGLEFIIENSHSNKLRPFSFMSRPIYNDFRKPGIKEQPFDVPPWKTLGYFFPVSPTYQRQRKNNFLMIYKGRWKYELVIRSPQGDQFYKLTYEDLSLIFHTLPIPFEPSFWQTFWQMINLIKQRRKIL